MNPLTTLTTLALLLPAAPSPTTPQSSFSITTIDGRTLNSSRLSINASGMITLDPSAAASALSLDDVARILPRARDAAGSQPAPAADAVEFILGDAGRLRGRILDQPSPGRGVTADIGFAEPIFLPFESLAAIRTSVPADEAADRELQSRLVHRDTTRDFLIAIGPSGVSALPGALEQLTPDEWSFRLGSQLRRGALNRTYAIVLGSGTWSDSGKSARVALRRGGDFSASIAAADESNLSMTASFGAALKLPWESIDRIDFRSNKIEFVSDLKPSRVVSRGFFGRTWPWKANQALYGGQLKIGDETFTRGLAVHARSELAYDLPETFAELRATIGIDDSNQKNGNVIFRVRADDKTLFDSGPVKAGDAPREIAVPLTGVRNLTLEVDYGDGLDIGDWAVWGQARLIR